MRRHHALGWLLLGTLLLSAPAAAQARELDWVLTIQSVPGCSSLPNQLGKIDVLELHQLWFGVESATPAAPQTREFILTKEMDCASRLLWDNYRLQNQFSELILEGYETGGQRRLFQRIELRNAFIQSLETSDRFPDDRPLERIRWVYDWMEITSYCFRPSDGTSCGDFQFSYDFSSGGP